MGTKSVGSNKGESADKKSNDAKSNQSRNSKNKTKSPDKQS